MQHFAVNIESLLKTIYFGIYTDTLKRQYQKKSWVYNLRAWYFGESIIRMIIQSISNLSIYETTFSFKK